MKKVLAKVTNVLVICYDYSIMKEYEEAMIAGGATIIEVDETFVEEANQKLSEVAYSFEEAGEMRQGIYDELAALLGE